MLVYGRNVAVEILKKPEKVQKIILQQGFDDKKILTMIEKSKIPYSFRQKKKLIVWQMVFIRVYFFMFVITNIIHWEMY